mgnify:FL=1
MPICIQNELPVKNKLLEEGVVVIEENRAKNQDIRPLKILILNLMPKKEETETQLLRLIGNSPLQINVEFLMVKDHESKNTNLSHIEKFYQYFDDIKDNFYDALIVTGAPVEQMEYEEVDYWKELQKIFEWSKTHVFSCLHICWAAQARLYNDYKIAKTIQPAKVFGVFEHEIVESGNPLIRGFSDVFLAPHSRHTHIDENKLASTKELEILAKSEVGSLLISTEDLRKIFITGHLEYDRETLLGEYRRDKDKGLEIQVPVNYFPNDDDTKKPLQTWKTTAHLFYHNWLNAVYQLTPYDLKDLAK